MGCASPHREAPGASRVLCRAAATRDATHHTSVQHKPHNGFAPAAGAPAAVSTCIRVVSALKMTQSSSQNDTIIQDRCNVLCLPPSPYAVLPLCACCSVAFIRVYSCRAPAVYHTAATEVRTDSPQQGHVPDQTGSSRSSRSDTTTAAAKGVANAATAASLLPAYELLSHGLLHLLHLMIADLCCAATSMT